MIAASSSTSITTIYVVLLTIVWSSIYSTSDSMNEYILLNSPPTPCWNGHPPPVFLCLAVPVRFSLLFSTLPSFLLPTTHEQRKGCCRRRPPAPCPSAHHTAARRRRRRPRPPPLPPPQPSSVGLSTVAPSFLRASRRRLLISRYSRSR